MSFFAGACCEKCGATISYSHTGKEHIKRRIREEGWSVSRKDKRDVVHCPKCKIKRSRK